MAENGNSLVKKEDDRITAYLAKDGVKKMLNTALRSQEAVAKFTADVTSVVSVNPTLQGCTSLSIVSGALVASSLKLSLSPTLGHCYLVPYNGKNGLKTAQFQMGYKGYVQLAIRSGLYENINVISIKKGELLSWNPLTEEIKVKIIEDDFEREDAETIGYYAYFKLTGGFKKQIYWSKEKMLKHADRYSKAFSLEAVQDADPKRCRVSYADFAAGKVKQSEMWKYSSFWYTDFDGMAYKTMLRQLISKWGVMSVDIEKAMTQDIEYNEEYFTDEPDTAPAQQENYTADDFFASDEEAEAEVIEAEQKAIAAQTETPAEEQPKKTTRKTAKKSAATLFDDDGEGELPFK